MPAKRRSGTRSAASSTARPPEAFRLFLDESLDSPTIAEALRAAGARVVRLTEVFARGTADEIWLAEAGKQNWIVMTRDKRIRFRQLERLALHAAGVRAFVFTGGNVRLQDTAAILVKALRRVERICQAEKGPFIYHIGLSGNPIRMR